MSHPKKISKPLLPSKPFESLKRVPVNKLKKGAQKNKDRKIVQVDIRPTKEFKSRIELIKRTLIEQPTVAIPHTLKPMLASITEEPFNHAAWQFEIKWDGYRALSYLWNGHVELRSRNNNSFNQKYLPVYEALQNWPVNAVVDGEIVVLNTDGKSDFKALQDWQENQNGEMVYFVFDLLWFEGFDLANLPLIKRQEILKQLIPETGVVRFSESIDEYGIDFYQIAKANGLEGIIAKDKNAPYQTGQRTKSWLKIKLEERHEAVICGYTKKENSDRPFSSLVIGGYKNNKLTNIGQVGTGFNQAMQMDILKKLKPLITNDCPFDEIPRTTAPTVWVQPALVCEVKYTELTSEGVMRHPSFQGLREDKSILDINDERTNKEAPKKRTKKSTATQKENVSVLVDRSKEATVVTLNNQEVKLSNLKKLFWIKEGITKGDLLNYYHRIASYIMPYLKDRPQSLNRFPNGIHGESFYQKNMGGKVEKWIKTFKRFSESTNEDKDFMICADEASMLYMVNLGCIELNPWHSRVQSPHYPDWSVIDLDPGNISFDKVVETAMVTKKVLDALQVPSFPKTSGSTGIHIYVPLGARYNYEQSKQFAELIAHLVHEELPDFTSLVRNPEKRKDKIYIDYLQNRPIQTICAPYSVRPKPGATVSAPLHWSEVKKGLSMQQFTMHTIFERLKTEGDLFTGVLKESIDLNRVLKALSGLVM